MSRTVYGYVRISPSNAGERDSLAQKKAISADWYARYAELEEFEWGGFIEDETSGEVPFANREGGLKLTRSLERGDVVVFSKIDRGFRDFVDLLLTMRSWEAMGVTARFLDINLDTSSPLGELLLQLLGLFAQWEKKRIRERTRETMAARRLNGMAVGRPPYGFKCQGRRGARKLVPWPEQRAAGRRVIELRDQHAFSWLAIYLKMSAETWHGRLNKKLGWQSLRKWYYEEKALQAREQKNGEEAVDGVSG